MGTHQQASPERWCKLEPHHPRKSRRPRNRSDPEWDGKDALFAYAMTGSAVASLAIITAPPRDAALRLPWSWINGRRRLRRPS